MPRAVVPIAEMDTTNAPAIANGAGQRTASHSSSGSVKASGSNESHDDVGWGRTWMATSARNASTAAPSVNALREGGTRQARASSITSGAKTTMPIPLDRNHTRQMSKIGAAGSIKVVVAAPT